MNDNCFIDTNILVYCYTGDEPEKQRKALDIANRPDTYISTQVLTELSNTLKRRFDLNWKEIESVLSEVSSGFNIHINKPVTIERACRVARKYQYSFYDSLILAAALSCNCKTLYSEDMQDGQKIEKKLTILNPFK